MLFHITAAHDNLSCGGVQARKSGIDISTPEYRSEQTRWMEGNDKVKVVAAYQNQPSHRLFVIVEADNYDDLNAFTNRWKDSSNTVRQDWRVHGRPSRIRSLRTERRDLCRWH